MLPLTDPQKPAASSRSLAHMEMRGMTSLASPIKVAPLTGLVSWPFSIKKPSSTAKLNWPVGPTLPPPIDLQ